MKFLVKIDKSMRAVTINYEFSLPRLMFIQKIKENVEEKIGVGVGAERRTNGVILYW